MEKITIRGIPFDNVDMAEAVSAAESLMHQDGVSVVVTPNAEIAEACVEDTSLAQIICRADLILPDGAGVLLAAKILGTPLREKVAGVEFGERLLALAAEKGYRVFLLGGKQGVAEAAAANLCKKLPTLSVVGTRDGYFAKSGAENDDVLRQIHASDADILLVCLGAPLQERWLAENKDKLTKVRLAACLGGSLDIYAGTAKRAPSIFIRLHAEWLYRLLREPSRIGRMMKLPKYILGACKEKRAKKE